MVPNSRKKGVPNKKDQIVIDKYKKGQSKLIIENGIFLTSRIDLRNFATRNTSHNNISEIELTPPSTGSK